MPAEMEYGGCEVCGKEAPLQRKYYNYDVKCECCSPNHFELVRHCKDCEPKEPKTTSICRGKYWEKVETKNLEKEVE